MEPINYLKIVLGLIGLLYVLTDAQDADDCNTLTACLQYSSECITTAGSVQRRVCLRVVETAVLGACTLTTTGGGTSVVQGLCVAGGSGPVPPPVSGFNNEICVDVAPTGTASFTVDASTNAAIPVGGTGTGAISLITDTTSSFATSVRCDFLTDIGPCPNPATEGFLITITSEACTCTCGAWTDSSTCSVTCGTASGTKTQTRTCTPTAPSTTCTEATTQTVACVSTVTCPTTVVTSTTCTCQQWASWSTCSTTCGSGTQSRTRTCSGTNCSGTSTTESQTCSQSSCPNCLCLPNWTTWSTCSATCGSGIRTRAKPCASPTSGDCSSQVESQSAACNTQDCTSTGTGSTSCNCQQWGSWGSCSKTCGGGTQPRTRTCSGANCPGTTELRDCNESTCPVAACDTSCSTWATWSACTATCAGTTGVKTRSRTCPAGSNCDSSDVEVCFSTATCGTNGGWSIWNNWGSCFPSCTGRRQRTRQCNNPLSSGSGQFCPGPSFDFGPCPPEDCTTTTPRIGPGVRACRRNCRRGCRNQNPRRRRRCRRRCRANC